MPTTTSLPKPRTGDSRTEPDRPGIRISRSYLARHAKPSSRRTVRTASVIATPVLAAGLALSVTSPVSAAPIASAAGPLAQSALTQSVATVSLAARARTPQRFVPLRRGSQGPAVRLVQARLGVKQTGYYGLLTRAAVIKFQRRHGLVANGIIGPRTWHGLRLNDFLRARSRVAHWTKPITASYRITADFGRAGRRWARNHTGIDLAAPTGTLVRSVGTGRIVDTGWAGSYGYRVVIKHSDGTFSWYCHLSRILRRSGAVKAGTTIARVGSTGNATGPHLHLEIRTRSNVPVPPAPWLRKHGVRL